MTVGTGSFARFVAVGPCGLALGGLQYELLWRANPLAEGRAWTTWIVSSLIGIAWIHAVHCRFTFRRPLGETWLRTLPRAYLLQGASAALGAIGVQQLDAHGAHHTAAWLAMAVATSALNYVGLAFLLRVRRTA